MVLEIQTLTNLTGIVVDIRCNKSISRINLAVFTRTMTQKLLEKTLKDAIKEDQCILGTKQVLNTISKSKLVILSKSVPEETYKKIQTDANKSNITTLKFDGTSVNLGKLCGLQFRISAVSLPKISESDIKSLLKENENL